MTAAELGKVTIRKNDQVQVIAGREKGKTGKVLSVNAKSGRVLVEKVNLIKRHVKPSQKNPGGGIVEQESSVHYSNVLLMCSKCNRGVRHGVKWIAEGAGKKTGKKAATEAAAEKKVRICKRCGESLETA